MDIYPNEDKALAIEDAFMAFVLAYKMDPKHEKDIDYIITKNAKDPITDSLFMCIAIGYIDAISEFNILYSYEYDDVIFEVRFFKQENEMAEFIGHWIGRMKKSGAYQLQFETAEDFINFFNEFRTKSMKNGSSYGPWKAAN